MSKLGADVGEDLTVGQGSRNQIAVFDDEHGQSNWAATGYASREIDTNFAGFVAVLSSLGLASERASREDIAEQLASAALLVIPPPAGRYDAGAQAWRREPATLFRPEDFAAILRFVRDGGRLIAFAYRFGDAFTRSNLGILCSALGCLLLDTAVVNLRLFERAPHPLLSVFTTGPDQIEAPWARSGVATVQWCAASTFHILPGATAMPLVCSPGGEIAVFDRTHRRLSFLAQPIAVAGTSGKGRFLLFGGPHLFEIGHFGLLEVADNARFLRNSLEWLMGTDQVSIPERSSRSVGKIPDLDLEAGGDGGRLVENVEWRLRRTGLLRALRRARWAD